MLRRSEYGIGADVWMKELLAQCSHGCMLRYCGRTDVLFYCGRTNVIFYSGHTNILFFKYGIDAYTWMKEVLAQCSHGFMLYFTVAARMLYFTVAA